MPIDPSIPLQAKNPQIQTGPNQLAMVGEAMKIGEMQRGVDTQNKLRELYSQGIDVGTPEGFKQVASIDPGTALKLRADALQGQKLQGEIKKTNVDIDQKTFDLAKQRMGDLAFNPSDSNIRAHLEDGILRKEITPAQANATWQQVSALPVDQRKAYFTDLGLKVDQRAQIATQRRGQDITASTTIRGQDLTNQRALENQRLQFDPTVQGNIAGAKTKAQEAAKREVAGDIDVTSNRKALAQAGYDVTTGKDDITDLIKKSTGSYIGKAVDISGRAIGKSTQGSEALAALEQKANAITFGLLNGKLGAGISKSDAELVASLVGRLGDGTLPVDDRLAAWDSAKNMMKNLGMVAEPTGSPKPSPKPSTPTNKTPKLPSGFNLD
jgi:hypothetical protein